MRRSGPTASNEHQLLALSDNERKKKKITRRPTENGSGSFEIEFTIKKKKRTIEFAGTRREAKRVGKERGTARLSNGNRKNEDPEDIENGDGGG